MKFHFYLIAHGPTVNIFWLF